MDTTHLSSVEILFRAGAIAGCIDLAAATTFSAIRGVTPKRLLQAIASALIGAKAFAQRRAMALVVILHFAIACTVAAIYVVASRYLPVLDRHPVASGLLYGVGVHLVMTFLVLPLTSLKRPFSKVFFAVQLVIHAFCVGLPIALVTHHFSLLG